MNVSPEEFDYFNKRAEIQLELAQRSTHPAVVAAHCAIANSYLELTTYAVPKAEGADK